MHQPKKKLTFLKLCARARARRGWVHDGDAAGFGPPVALAPVAALRAHAFSLLELAIAEPHKREEGSETRLCDVLHEERCCLLP